LTSADVRSTAVIEVIITVVDDVTEEGVTFTKVFRGEFDTREKYIKALSQVDDNAIDGLKGMVEVL
jgi:hypothetical protein